MYFPYLYGRRSEFLAIRAVLEDERDLESLVPIIEPVNSNIGDLERCLERFGEDEQEIVVLFNPDKHQLKDAKSRTAFQRAIVGLLKKYESLIPGYRCHAATSKANVDAFFKIFPDKDLAILYASSGLSNADTEVLSKNGQVKYHIVLQGKITSAQLAYLPKKKYVDVRDDFNKLDRNADYGDPELFTDRHKTFGERGVGFGDYCAIGSAFQDTGGMPHAIAIHAIYKNPKTDDIWIEHFVSDDKEKEVGDVASKFLQAASKLVKAVGRRPAEFGSNFALDAYEQQVKDSHFPGLAKSKEQQIEHHLCLMMDVLSGTI